MYVTKTSLSEAACHTVIELLPGLEWLVGSVLGSRSCLMQRRGFDAPLGIIFPAEGIFPLEVTLVLAPFP